MYQKRQFGEISDASARIVIGPPAGKTIWDCETAFSASAHKTRRHGGERKWLKK